MTLAIQGPITRDPGPMTLAIPWPHHPGENVDPWGAADGVDIDEVTLRTPIVNRSSFHGGKEVEVGYRDGCASNRNSTRIPFDLVVADEARFKTAVIRSRSECVVLRVRRWSTRRSGPSSSQ